MRRGSGLAVVAFLASAPVSAQEAGDAWAVRFGRAADDGERLALVDGLDPGDVPGAIGDLAAALGSGRIGRSVRVRIAERLAADGGRAAFDVLAAEIRDGTAVEVRRAALAGLPQTADPRVFALALGALEDPNLRIVAASVLAELGDVRAVPPLRARLERFAARPGLVGPFGEALARLDAEQALEVLLPLYVSGASEDTVGEVVRAVGACRRAAGLRARLRADFDEGAPPLRARALAALVACGGLDSVSFLLGRLDARPGDRVEVIRALGALGHEFAVDPLGRRARTGSDAVRLAAVEALARIDHPIAGRELAEIARTGEDPLATSAALLAVASRGEGAAVAAVLARLSDERHVDWPGDGSARGARPARVCDAAYAAGVLLCGDPDGAAVPTAASPAARAALRARLEDRATDGRVRAGTSRSP